MMLRGEGRQGREAIVRRHVKLLIVWILIALWPTAAKALFRGQAILNRAVPGVGATVSLPPAELLLSFRQANGEPTHFDLG